MRRLPRLEIVASFGVGYEHVEAKWAREHGVIVTHTPGVLDDEVADTAMALTLMAVRRLPQAERFLRAGEWLKSSFPLTASLRERTMGILAWGESAGRSPGAPKVSGSRSPIMAANPSPVFLTASTRR